MRAKFVVKINPISDAQFPSNEDLVRRFSTVGLDEVKGNNQSPGERKEDFDDRKKAFQSKANPEWEAMPNVAAEEKDHVIFYAKLPNQGRIIVTRHLCGRATVRLIHDDLARLEHASEWLAVELGKKVEGIEGLEIEEDRIEIYERGQDNVILIGKVIRNALGETARRYPGEWISGLITGIAAVISILVLAFTHLALDKLPGGTLSRFSTAMIAAFFITTTAFFQHAISIKRLGKIEWRPAHKHGATG